MRTFAALSVWERPEVRQALSWYYRVAINERPAKYLICRRIASPLNPREAGEEELWRIHEELSNEFWRIFPKISSGETGLNELEPASPNLLDLKAELAERMLRHCNFCRWNCRVDRSQGSKHGTCQLESVSRVSSYFHHRGEELPIRGTMGSGTIFFTSCNMRCAFCLHPDNYVITSRGPRRIEDVFNEAGDEIIHGKGYVRFPRELYTYTYDGREVRVAKLFKHYYKGKLIVIRPLNAPSIVVTPTHELVVYDRECGKIEKRRACEINIIKHRLIIPRIAATQRSEIFIDVEEIIGAIAQQPRYSVNVHPEKGLAVAELAAAGLTSSEISTTTGYHPAYIRTSIADFENRYVRLKTVKRSGIPSRLKLDEELAELLGYYCSGGHISRADIKPNSYRLLISLDKDEERIAYRTAELLKKKFGVNPRIVKRRATLRVEVGNSSLALLFKALCGGNAYEKRVPLILFSASPPIMEAFLEAVAARDGCLTEGYLSISTVSREMALGLYGLYIMLGHLPSYTLLDPLREKNIDGRRIKQSRLYCVKLRVSRMRNKPWDKAKHAGYGLLKNSIAVPIHAVSTIDYSGPVYNMEVSDESHTYTASYLAVGNCQNGDISRDKDNGIPITPHQLAAIMWELRMEGCHNINLVGGEPTIHLHTIMRAISMLRHSKPSPSEMLHIGVVKADYLMPSRMDARYAFYGSELNVPILWNSNMYMSMETMRLLREVVDIWLPDFKFGNNRCAINLSRTPWYFETVSSNHKMIYEWGEDIVIRHLVMPNHVEDCSKPVLRWIAENMPGVLVNIMDQYHPDCYADPTSLSYDPRYSEISRRPTRREILEAYEYAEELGLNYEVLSLEGSRRFNLLEF